MRLLVTGVRSCISGLVRASEDVRKAYQRSARREAERIMTESQQQVPVKTGNLKNSKFIEAKNHKDGCTIRLGYRAAYAVFVHEIPTNVHPHGKWKFLEDPIKAAVHGLDQRIVEGMMRGLRGKKGFGARAARALTG